LGAGSADPGPLPEDESVWSRRRETGLVGSSPTGSGLAYRFLRLIAIVVLRGVLGFRIEVQGREHLPTGGRGRTAGGWIAAALPHRTWVDPFVLLVALAARPRLVFFGDGRAMFRSPWRRFWVHRIGGFIPIWVRRYAPGVEREDVIGTYLGAVREALDAGAILALMPETGPPVPVERARPLGRGLAYFALRTGAPVVPIILGGTHVLYRGRRIIVRILPPREALQLAGRDRGAPPPAAWSAEERIAARRMTAALQELTAGPVAEVYAAAEPGPGTRRRWLWLTHLWR